jgi:Family of unknown function (DUF6281)
MHSKLGTRTTRTKALLSLLCAVSGLALTSCSSAGHSVGHGDASCAKVISYQGKKYYDFRPLGRDAENTKVGLGAWVHCDDNRGNDRPSGGDSTGAANVSVFVVTGVDPEVAVAASDHTETLELFVASGREDSPEVRAAVNGN